MNALIARAADEGDDRSRSPVRRLRVGLQGQYRRRLRGPAIRRHGRKRSTPCSSISSRSTRTGFRPATRGCASKRSVRHLPETVFAWIGQFDPVSPFYYRIYNPVIFIEFYHQPGVALANTGYNRKHAHALVRTPNGNDYGRALLTQSRTPA